MEEVRVQLGGGVKHCGCSHRRVLQTTRAREGTASSAFIIVKNAQDLFRHLRRTNALKKLGFCEKYPADFLTDVSYMTAPGPFFTHVINIY